MFMSLETYKTRYLQKRVKFMSSSRRFCGKPLKFRVLLPYVPNRYILHFNDFHLGKYDLYKHLLSPYSADVLAKHESLLKNI